MTRTQALVGIIATMAFLFAPEVAAQNCAALTARFQPKLGSGYTSNVIATGLRSPRHIAIDSAGNLLVAEGGSGSVIRLVLKENADGTVCVQSSAALTTDRSTNHGIALSADGKTLYTSSLASVTAYPYDAAAGTIGAGKVIISGMSNTGTHPTRAILISKSSPDTLLVARGSNGNIDTATATLSTARSVIKTFSLSKVASSPADFATGGETLGWGLRNIVGMGEDPISGGVWSVENSMDDVRFGGRDVHNDNPAEKANYHGVLNATTNSLKGANFGYPSCVPAWDPSVLGTGGYQVGSLFKADSTPAAPDCATYQKGRLHFPAHTAPLDIKFNANATSAYIAFHGSWNRSPPDGYRVMRVDFKSGQPVAEATSKTAQVPVMENINTASCPRSCFRPVGLDFDKKGRLYVSSDTSGEVHVVYGA
ncbi:soluble quino protein glucose/sorbosone dehydrogenase [Immersiella caudata]|uniref:Soluble quino protein glucose/sorbosone dehydrogenase n=1 Tax=Immersiella caudata TaxID=314043 RepID=A0AA39WFZ7_9PEZI|nr:soluble quino protein glucose/sorbosone dehydrogenase [Immersiella caudata]